MIMGKERHLAFGQGTLQHVITLTMAMSHNTTFTREVADQYWNVPRTKRVWFKLFMIHVTMNA